MSVVLRGAWSIQEVEAYLGEAQFPLRLACLGGDGFPRVVSLWYQFAGGSLYCVTHRDSQLAGMLRQCDRVGFEVSPNEPPYFGVRGQGTVIAQEAGAGEALDRLLQHYLGGFDSRLARWLQSRAEDELLLTITPARFYSWDYRERMSDLAD